MSDSSQIKLIRTVIVDDSAFVRKVVREMLSSSPQIDVVGVARNGKEALELVADLKPDVVTCDLVMPELDGVGFVRRQMELHPVPIIILTATPEDGASVLEALSAGAVDFVQKPSARASEDLLTIRAELVDKVKMAAQVHPHSLPCSREVVKETNDTARPVAKNADIVVLGISTGGPQALRYLLPRFPANFPVPLAIVLHMPPGYTAAFAERLAELSKIKVKEAFQGCPVLAGEALLAPGGKHLSFYKSPSGQVSARLSLKPATKPHRPSVDVLFESAANVYGKRVLGVVMTGMGDDGKLGASWIKAQGGMILTESEESCIIYGMPRSVVESGLSDATASLDSMVAKINNFL